MEYFKQDYYKTFRGFWFLLGFGGIVLPFTMFIQKTTYDTKNLVVLVVIILILPAMLLAKYLQGYLAIDDEMLLISKIFWQVRIPIGKIQAVSYEARVNTFVIVILYEEKSKSRRYTVAADFLNTKTLLALNEALLRKNPNIEIRNDERSKDWQTRNVNQHLKAPDSFSAKTMFAISWTCLGAVTMFILLLMLAPKK